MFQKIVVGTDGFGPASKAVERAAELAQSTVAELVAVCAYPPPETDPFGVRGEAPGINAALGILKTVEDKLSEAVKLRTLSRAGNPAEVLVEVAEEENADLIVVGNKGMSKKFRTGSVPNLVSHHAPCNVLIVHTTE